MDTAGCAPPSGPGGGCEVGTGKARPPKSVCRPVRHGFLLRGVVSLILTPFILMLLLKLFGLSEENLTLEVRKLHSRLLRQREANSISSKVVRWNISVLEVVPFRAKP